VGIGHVYSHEDEGGKFQQSPATSDCQADCEGAGTHEMDDEDSTDRQGQTLQVGLTLGKNSCDSDVEDGDGDDPELGMGVRGDDDFSDGSSSDSESIEQDGEETEGDEEYLELIDSYYTDY
jgi:hypothetical protein